MRCGNCHGDHADVATVKACYAGAFTSNESERLELRREVNRLGQVLIHDCYIDGEAGPEECHCFGQADIDAYESARAALQLLDRPLTPATETEPVWSDRTPRGNRTPVPAEFVAPVVKADKVTEKQLGYLNKLLDERPAFRDVENLWPENLEKLTKREASKLIERVLASPKESAKSGGNSSLNDLLANVPDCYVAMPSRTGNNDLDFFRVGTNQGQMDASKKGWRRVQRIVGGQAPISMRIGEMTPVAKIIAGWSEEELKAAQVLFGREIGRCGVCGKTLTDETSRRLGIGPVCRDGF